LSQESLFEEGLRLVRVASAGRFECNRDVVVEFLGAAQGAAKAVEFELAGGELPGRLTQVTSLSKRAGVAGDIRRNTGAAVFSVARGRSRGRPGRWVLVR